jgi:uncharacterized protein
MNMVTDIAAALWGTVTEMAPYLLFGFTAAGFLSVVISPETVERHLGGRGIMPSLKATLFGIPLPLCSCGVIPVAASLRKHGASRGATVAFLLSTPQTGVDSIMATWALLGPIFAVFRPFGALLTGLVGGILTDRLDGQESAPTAGVVAGGTGPGTEDRGHWLVRALRYGFVDLPRDLATTMLLGLAVAGAIAVLVPDNYFQGSLGGGLRGMLIMMLFGIPLYVCATGSVPIAAALIAKGVSPGAALVFLMTGPATNAAAIAAVWKVLGRKTALIYLGSVAGASLVLGLALDYLFTVSGVSAQGAAHAMLPPQVGAACAVLLLGVLGFALWRPAGKPAAAQGPSGDRAVMLKVGGMTCQHCVKSVTRALKESPGVATADVSLSAGTATVTGKDLDPKVLVSAVEELGYSAAPAP